MSAHDTGRRWVAPAHLGVAAALCVVAGLLRAGPLGPSSLWLDDAWVALVSKTQGVSDTFMVGLTGPGFAFLLKGWLALVGFSETAAQLPAFAFAVVAPGLLYLVAVARGLSFAGALVAGALLAASPVHIVYATRVKHYTLDALLAVVLIGLAWALVQQPNRRQWVWLVALSCLAVAVSGGVAPVAAGALGAGLVAAVGRGRAAAVEAVVACGAWAAFAGAWYLGVLAPAITPAIRGYWADRYVSSAADVGSGLAGVAEGFTALPALAVWALVAAGVVALVLRRRVAEGVLFLGPLVVVAMLAALQLAPLGGGRTDAALYPGLALLAGAAVAWIGSRLATRPAPAVAVAVGIGIAALVMAGPAPPYPREDVRPLVAQLQAERQPGEPLVVYPSTIWAYALYTEAPVTLHRDASSPWGFRPQVDDTSVTLLEASRDQPQHYVASVTAAAQDADRLWLLSSHQRADVVAIEEALRDAGLAARRLIRRPGAQVLMWR